MKDPELAHEAGACELAVSQNISKWQGWRTRREIERRRSPISRRSSACDSPAAGHVTDDASATGEHAAALRGIQRRNPIRTDHRR